MGQEETKPIGKPLTLDSALELVSRMAQMYRYPPNDSAVKELAKALLVGPNETIPESLAERVIDDILETATSETLCPMPGDLRRAVCSHLDDYRPDPECPRCKGVGDIFFEDKEGYTSAKKCNCWKRRPAPVYERMPDNPPADLVVGVAKAARRAKGKAK